ncbi:kinase-like protein [Panus rudis PR-1116 ss-1]|nr:kinase-like protein [Panus rudis PR-1116 ss-1]
MVYQFSTHLVALCGVSVEGPKVSLLYEWMPNGTIMEYIARLESTNQLECVVDALDFLHKSGVVHGDVKGNNILVDGQGKPRLADFGSARFVGPKSDIHEDYTGRIMSALSSTTSTRSDVGYTPQFTAPEYSETGKATFASDVFSFGLLICQVYNGSAPYPLSLCPELEIKRGKRPQRPAKLRYDKVWALAQRCWDHDQHRRPTANQCYNTLAGMAYCDD